MRINLKVFRVKQLLTQQEMADKIGCTRAAYTAIEKGTREGRQDFWESLQQAFDISDAEMWSLKKNGKEKVTAQN